MPMKPRKSGQIKKERPYPPKTKRGTKPKKKAVAKKRGNPGY